MQNSQQMKLLDIKLNEVKLDNYKLLVNHFEQPANYGPEVLEAVNNEHYLRALFGNRNNLVVLDIGANAGLYSHFFAPVAKHVYAIEPDASFCKVLNSTIHEMNSTKISVHQCGIWTHTGSAEYFIKLVNTTENTISRLFDKQDEYHSSGMVDVFALPDFFTSHEINYADVVKIDIAGGEKELIFSKSFSDSADKIGFMVVSVYATRDADAEKNLSAITFRLENLGFFVERLGLHLFATNKGSPAYIGNNRLKVFVLGYNGPINYFDTIPDYYYLQKVNLSELPLGELQANELSEHRIFLSDVPEKADCEYVGFATWRWLEKFPHVCGLEKLATLPLASNVVYCAAKFPNWLSHSIRVHSGMDKYLQELADYTKLPLKDGTGFYCNQFICHKKVYLQWQEFFRDAFQYFHKKYKFNYNFSIHPDPHDMYKLDNYRHRAAAAFYERFASFYFGNRNDLILKDYNQ